MVAQLCIATERCILQFQVLFEVSKPVLYGVMVYPKQIVDDSEYGVPCGLSIDKVEPIFQSTTTSNGK